MLEHKRCLTEAPHSATLDLWTSHQRVATVQVIKLSTSFSSTRSLNFTSKSFNSSRSYQAKYQFQEYIPLKDGVHTHPSLVSGTIQSHKKTQEISSLFYCHSREKQVIVTICMPFACSFEWASIVSLHGRFTWTGTSLDTQDSECYPSVILEPRQGQSSRSRHLR